MASIKLTLREVREFVRQVLVETVVVADKSDGSEAYRAVELINPTKDQYSAGSSSSGKLLILPLSVKYHEIDKILRSMGLQPNKSKGETGEYHNIGPTMVVDHERSVIDLDASRFENFKGRRPHPKNQNKSFVIPHEGTSGSRSVDLQKSFKALLHHDKRLKPTYSVVGNPKYDGMTIADVLKMERPGDQVAKGGVRELVFYHGTSSKRWERIKAQGLAPGNAPEAYVDLVQGYSEHNVYLTTSVEEAENYATRAAVDDKAQAVVLKVIVRQADKLVLDEDNANWLVVPAPGPPWTNIPKGEPLEMHFRHVYQSGRWQDWPNAGQIMAMYQRKLIKTLHRTGTIGYRGKVPAKDISVFASYKPESMSISPKDDEFLSAKEKTLSSYSSEDPTDKTKKKTPKRKVA